MGDEDDSVRPLEPISNHPDPPYQALLPNLDRMSRSSFEKGTVSRRRINRASLLLALISVAVLAAIFLPQLL
jgi:hypothetical protein